MADGGYFEFNTSWFMKQEYGGVALSSPPAWARGRSASDYCGEIANFLRSTPDAWNKGALARGPHGNVLSDIHSPWARSWCMQGLVIRFIDDGATQDEVRRRLTFAIGERHTSMPSIEAFNDEPLTRLEDVVAVFERAALTTPKLLTGVEEFCQMLDQPKPEEVVLYGFGEPKLIVQELTPIAVPKWDELITPLPDVLLKKLVPWETIMDQIESVARAQAA